MSTTSFRCSANNAVLLMISILVQLQMAHAWLWDGPQETSTVPLNIGSWILEPTAAPIGDLELFKRQNQLVTSICGYISSELNNPITCPTGYCGFQSALDVVGCCNSYYISTGVTTLTDCGFHTACYDSTAVNQCSGSCLANTNILKCTASTNPFCYKFTYTDIKSSILVCSFTPEVVSVGQLAAATPTTPPVTNLPTSQPGASQSLPGWVTTSYSGVSFTSAPSSPVTASPVSTTASTISSGPSTHVGIIAAAAIGAAALAIVIGGVLLYFCLRKKA
ncbi:hypothetical protein N431DRAFT_448695 [Stipitochalara longipes BDJ]|nr:hypothetical protein N431DRAFT_448695 [Stipitochalara longipes BDJ]